MSEEIKHKQYQGCNLNVRLDCFNCYNRPMDFIENGGCRDGDHIWHCDQCDTKVRVL